MAEQGANMVVVVLRGMSHRAAIANRSRLIVARCEFRVVFDPTLGRVDSDVPAEPAALLCAPGWVKNFSQLEYCVYIFVYQMNFCFC